MDERDEMINVLLQAVEELGALAKYYAEHKERCYDQMSKGNKVEVLLGNPLYGRARSTKMDLRSCEGC